jgi:phage FluMu protein gp41
LHFSLEHPATVSLTAALSAQLVFDVEFSIVDAHLSLIDLHCLLKQINFVCQLDGSLSGRQVFVLG